MRGRFRNISFSSNMKINAMAVFNAPQPTLIQNPTPPPPTFPSLMALYHTSHHRTSYQNVVSNQLLECPRNGHASLGIVLHRASL
eukprot:UN09514